MITNELHLQSISKCFFMRRCGNSRLGDVSDKRKRHKHKHKKETKTLQNVLCNKCKCQTYFPLKMQTHLVSVFSQAEEREREREGDRDTKFESAVNKNCYSVHSSLHAIRGDYKSRRREGWRWRKLGLSIPSLCPGRYDVCL